MTTNGWEERELSDLSGIPLDELQDLLNNRAYITLKLADLLATTLGGSRQFWIQRDQDFRSVNAGLISKEDEWAERFPVHEMVKLGWIDSEQLEISGSKIISLFQFFGISSVSEWDKIEERLLSGTSFRQSNAFDLRVPPTVAWLHMAEQTACEKLVAAQPASSVLQAIPRIRELACLKDPEVFLPELYDVCKSVGVTLVVLPPLKGCIANGAVRRLKNSSYMIALTLRYRSDDQFWFTLFHELGHIVLHLDEGAIIETIENEHSKIEAEANLFAEQHLLGESWKSYLPRTALDRRSIVALARKLGTSPGVLVGQLQFHKIIRFDQFNELKRRYSWGNDWSPKLRSRGPKL